eukprot:CAMPEP_0170747720 /NCGR_PEP_ID=MMETSP0437-20130122/9469_1 /TAXON_ID=0 /ORGANISM="Sexangularia sp." /LENGTH=273 /DNA_ID=CAMNT_0011086509 /DNA_START=71 /DNA_END=891 /DNA_ORIENTATION=+
MPTVAPAKFVLGKVPFPAVGGMATFAMFVERIHRNCASVLSAAARAAAACIGNEELCEVTTAALPTPSPTTPSTRTSTTLSATTPSPPTLPPRSVDTSVTTEVSSTSSTTSSTSSTSTSTALSSSSTAPSSNATSSSGLATAQVATEGESGVPTMVIIGVSCALIVACAGALAALVLHRRSRTTRRYHGDAASQGHMMSAYPSAAKQRSRKGSQRSLSRRASSTTLSHAAPVYSRWQSYAYGDLDPSQAPPTSAGSTSAMSYVVGNLGAGVAY